MRNLLQKNWFVKYFAVVAVLILISAPNITLAVSDRKLTGGWSPADVKASTSTYPLQTSKKPAPATKVTSDSAQCLIQDLAASIAKKGFAKFAEKTSSALANATLVPVYIPGLETKEVGTFGGYGPSEDGIAYCLVNSLIKAIADSTIDWINSGFKGNPVFVDDPSRLFKDLAEDTLNSFINSFGDGILCKDFSAEIKLALITKERPRRVYNCTYDDAKENIKRLKEDGVFTFSAWDEVTRNPQNNKTGAFLTLDSNFLAIKQDRETGLEKEIGWGSGFLPWKDKNDPNRTISPGTAIQNWTEQKLNLADNRLVLADEFDEVIDALVDQLIKQAAIQVLGEE